MSKPKKKPKSEPRPIVGVGMPEWLKLKQFGAIASSFFDAPAYLVGSAARGKEWRDVDVRVMLEYWSYFEMFGKGIPPGSGAKWEATCLAFAALGREMTGLPIDFQVQIEGSAKLRYKGPRWDLAAAF